GRDQPAGGLRTVRRPAEVYVHQDGVDRQPLEQVEGVMGRARVPGYLDALDAAEHDLQAQPEDLVVIHHAQADRRRPAWHPAWICVQRHAPRPAAPALSSRVGGALSCRTTVPLALGGPAGHAYLLSRFDSK